MESVYDVRLTDRQFTRNFFFWVCLIVSSSLTQCDDLVYSIVWYDLMADITDTDTLITHNTITPHIRLLFPDFSDDDDCPPDD